MGVITIRTIKPLEFVLEGQEAGIRHLTPMDALCGAKLDQVANLAEQMAEATKNGDVKGVMRVQREILLSCTDLSETELDSMQAGQRRRLIELAGQEHAEPEAEKKIRR